jgi:hypothetical protein
MKKLTILLLFAISSNLFSMSISMTAEGRFHSSKKVIHGKLLSVEEAIASTEQGLAIIEVFQSFKGLKNEEEVFYFHPYADMELEKLQKKVNKEFVVYLHDAGGSTKNWVMRAPIGLIELNDEIVDSIDDKNGNTKEIYFSNKDYINLLKAISND